MIKLCRVDHRLLHGQVAFSWCHAVGANCILVASDEAAADEIRMATMRLVKPAGTRLVIKSIADSVKAINSGVTDKYQLLIVTGSVADAARLAQECAAITAVNLGGTKKSSGTVKSFEPALHLTEEDCRCLKALAAKGIELEVRQVPSDKKTVLTEKHF